MTELEKAAVEAFKKLGSTSYLEIFKAGAEWQYEQFERNRLAACDNMTEEEVVEFNNIPSTKNYQIVSGDLPWDVANYKQIDWLNKNMFDYIGLIPLGLAIKVTEDNNPYKD